jgi:hypothetical protein
MLFGGTFDPAYTMTITALQSQLKPATNKRNTALLQKTMKDALGVPPERGILKFLPISEENFARNSKTVAGEIQDLEKCAAGDNSSLKKSLSRGALGHMKRQSMRSLRNLKMGSPIPANDELRAASVSSRDAPPLPSMPTDMGSMDRRAEKVQKMGRRKSFVASLFGKGAQ